MATQPRASTSVVEYCCDLLRAQDVGAQSAVISHYAVQLLPGCAVVVYVISDQENTSWIPKAWEGDVTPEITTLPLDTGVLGQLLEGHKPVLITGSELRREAVAHLDVRRTVTSIAYVPIQGPEGLVGTIELLTFEEPISEVELGAVVQLGEIGGIALAGSLGVASEQHSNLQSISRLTQLYDLVKVFSSTLEMSELFPIISSKFKDLLEVQAVNFWMIGAENELVLYNRAGHDPTIAVGTSQRSGEGYIAELADNGEPVLIGSQDDHRLEGRNSHAPDAPIWSAMAAPIVHGNTLVGVVEAINKTNGEVFDEDDLFFLTTITESAASALHNANLLQAERKVEILQALVQVSHEITSTLNMDRVMQAIVNGPSSVFRYERAAIATDQNGRLQVKAVSGMRQVNPGDAEVARLREILQWAVVLDNELLVKQVGENIDHPRSETREKFRRYFEETGMRAFYALPLTDEQGRVGILTFESDDPEFLGEAQLEMLRVLAGQATVALRNAELYREVPFIGVLEPILQKKRRFLALEKHKRLTYILGAVAVAVALIVVPFPMRVDGNAVVQAGRTAKIQPEFAGTLKQVFVREGQFVQKGAVLADMDDWDARAILARAQAKYTAALSEMNRALAGNDGTTAGIKRVESDYWSAEVNRAQEMLEHTHLRSPISGVVATPFVDTFAGKSLEPGDTFAEVVDTSRASVDVAVDESDIALVKSLQQARVKLASYPTMTFNGEVTIVSPTSVSDAEGRHFLARVDIPNSTGAVRAGMGGRGKVFVGWRPAGYVIFRKPAMWIWSHVWSWIG
jgi:RND family efflux transporter MFP subunit